MMRAGAWLSAKIQMLASERPSLDVREDVTGGGALLNTWPVGVGRMDRPPYNSPSPFSLVSARSHHNAFPPLPSALCRWLLGVDSLLNM